MNKQEKTVLIITTHFPPNVGGIESHLTALVSTLIEGKWNIFIATYQPLALSKFTHSVERQDNVTIYRFPWLGFNIFHKLASRPILEFLYLFPGLFLVSLFVLILHAKDIKVVHAQGLIPTVVAVILGKLFRKRVISSTHNLYFFPQSGLYPTIAKLTFSKANSVLVPTNFAKLELKRIGVPEDKIGIFKYWIDLSKFSPINKKEARSKTKWSLFTLLFVGRLIETKGVKLLLDFLPYLDKKIQLAIIGTGPLSEDIKQAEKKYPNLTYIGRIQNQDLPLYYSAADLVVVPSLVDEGFGFVVMESIACGTPVIASNKGGLSDAVSLKTGRLVKPTSENFRKEIEFLFRNPQQINVLKRSCRTYALKNFSKENVSDIITAYE